MWTGQRNSAYPDDEHGTLHFVGGGSDKLCGDSVHWVVQHADGRNELQQRQKQRRFNESLFNSICRTETARTHTRAEHY